MKTILSFLALFTFRPTTEKAVAGITKALDQLDAVVAAENKELSRLEDQITKAATKRIDAFERRDRATKIAQRFNDLVA